MLRLSSKTMFAIEAVLDIAYHAGSGPVQSAEITRRQGIPKRYLERALQELVRAGVLAGVRGPRGGYRLARTPAETAVADIVLAVDEPIRAVRCAVQGTPRGCMAGGERCITHWLWEDLGAEIHAYLAAVSLEDVVMKRTGLRRRAAPVLTEGAAA